LAGILYKVPAVCRALAYVQVFTATFWLGFNGVARAQEAIRSSLAGEEAANSRPDDTAPNGTFFRAGPFSFSADLSLEAEYNDNINLVDRKATAPVVADFVLRPRLTVRSNLLLTPRNNLAFDVGVGVDRYLGHSDRNNSSLSLAPGSQVTFNLYAGDFRFTFYDRFSLQQNPVSQATLSNTSQYGIFRNAAGTTALWDLSDLILAVGYERDNSISTVQDYDFSDYAQDVYYASLTVPLASNFFVGARAIYTVTDYTSHTRAGAQSLSLGGFVEGELTKYTRVSAFAGYRRYDFNSAFPFSLQQSSAQLIDSLDGDSSFFVTLGVINRLNLSVSQSLNVRYERRLGFFAPLEDYSDVRYGLQWRVNSTLGVSVQTFYEHLVEKGTVLNEELDRLGAIVSLAFQVTPRTAATLFYTWIHKDSNLPLQDYQQNVYGIELRYTF
jgi:hypothetical protein